MKNILTLVLFLSAVFTGSGYGQDKNVKQIRIVIAENGKKTDTSFVLTGKDDDEVNKLISVMLEDSTAQVNHGSHSSFMHSSGQPHMMVVTSDDEPGMGRHRNVMVMKKIQGDSLQLTYTIDDSSMVNVEKNVIIKNENGKVDTIILNGEKIVFTPGKRVMGMPLELDDSHGNVQVFVGDEPLDMNSFKWNDDAGKQLVMVHRDRPGMPAQVEIKDVARGNELMLQNLNVFSMAKGRLMLNFSTGEKGELKLKITDSKKKEVFSQNLKFFDGEFNQEVQLGPEANGSYILTITQGKKSTQKEITVR